MLGHRVLLDGSSRREVRPVQRVPEDVRSRNDRERERLEPVEELDGRDRHPSPSIARSNIVMSAPAQDMLEAAAQEHGLGACLLGLVEPAEHTIHQLGARHEFIKPLRP